MIQWSMTLCFIESQWICRAVSCMKMPPVREYASSLMAPIYLWLCMWCKTWIKTWSKPQGQGRSKRGEGWGLSPQSETHSPTCTGVYKEPSFESWSAPAHLQPPHFEKCSYAPAQGHRSVCWRAIQRILSTLRSSLSSGLI